MPLPTLIHIWNILKIAILGFSINWYQDGIMIWGWCNDILGMTIIKRLNKLSIRHCSFQCKRTNIVVSFLLILPSEFRLRKSLNQQIHIPEGAPWITSFVLSSFPLDAMCISASDFTSLLKITLKSPAEIQDPNHSLHTKRRRF